MFISVTFSGEATEDVSRCFNVLVSKANSQGSVPTYDCSACVLSTGNEVMKGSNGDKTLLVIASEGYGSYLLIPSETFGG